MASENNFSKYGRIEPRWHIEQTALVSLVCDWRYYNSISGYLSGHLKTHPQDYYNLKKSLDAVKKKMLLLESEIDKAREDINE